MLACMPACSVRPAPTARRPGPAAVRLGEDGGADIHVSIAGAQNGRAPHQRGCLTALAARCCLSGAEKQPVWAGMTLPRVAILWASR